MKKAILLASAAVLICGVSFASPLQEKKEAVKNEQAPKKAKKAAPKAKKAEKKVAEKPTPAPKVN